MVPLGNVIFANTTLIVEASVIFAAISIASDTLNNVPAIGMSAVTLGGMLSINNVLVILTFILPAVSLANTLYVCVPLDKLVFVALQVTLVPLPTMVIVELTKSNSSIHCATARSSTTDTLI